MGKTDPFTQFYPTGFTQWVKLTVPTLGSSTLSAESMMISHGTEGLRSVEEACPYLAN